MLPTQEREVPSVGREDKAALNDVQNVLSAEQESPPMIVGANGERVPLPRVVADLLRSGVAMLRHGKGVRLIPVHRELSTQEAADMLNVSRQYLVRLLDQGEIPFKRVGNRRRVTLEDVRLYKIHRDRDRLKGLAEMVAMDEKAGLFAMEAEEAEGEA